MGEPPVEPPPPPVEPPPAQSFIRVKVTADKCLLNEKVGEDKAKKPIIDIWHDEKGKVARFDPGTIFTVNAEVVIATGMIKFWQLYYKPQFYIRADACTKQ